MVGDHGSTGSNPQPEVILLQIPLLVRQPSSLFCLKLLIWRVSKKEVGVTKGTVEIELFDRGRERVIFMSIASLYSAKIFTV